MRCAKAGGTWVQLPPPPPIKKRKAKRRLLTEPAFFCERVPTTASVLSGIFRTVARTSLLWFRSTPSMTGLRILCNTRFVVLVSLPGFHRISFQKLTTDQTDRRGTITAFIRVDP